MVHQLVQNGMLGVTGQVLPAYGGRGTVCGGIRVVDWFVDIHVHMHVHTHTYTHTHTHTPNEQEVVK